MTSWVVVGAGAAGCVLAGRLAEHPDHDVTLVEAGPGDVPEAARGSSFFDALALPGRTHAGSFLRGRGLGGSGTVNGMVLTRGDLAQYAAWGWRDAVAAFARVKVPGTFAADDELGPLDRALLAAAPDAAKVPLARHDRRRVTPADAYLRTVDSGRLRVLAGVEVARVAFDGRRAVGVELADGIAVTADRVAVAAGAVGSPALLLRSGVDTAGVGEALRNHPGVPLVVRLRRGAEAVGSGLVTATLLRRGRIQLLPLNHLGPEAPGAAMLLVALLAPSGRGRVTVDATGAIGVQPAVTQSDRAELARAVVAAERLVDHPAFASVVDDLDVGAAPAGIFHPTSTCAMGRVVDGRGAVRGYEGLFVVDASAFPALPETNTYLPTMMLAERLAARLA